MIVTQGIVATHGSATLLARIVGWDAVAITQVDIASIAYTAYLQDAADPTVRTAISGHQAVAVPAASAIFDAIQTDSRWTADATGYNFRHTPPITANVLAGTPARQIVIEYTLTPATGEPIVVPFLLRTL